MVMDYETANALLAHKDGALYWKSRGIKNWDAVNAGRKVTYKLNGYIYPSINGRRYPGHSLVWLLEYGVWPKGQLDHINGVRDDNRPCNLRECSNAENNRAVGIKKNNTSGYKGVSLNKASGRFYSYIRVNYKRIHLGCFDSPEEAAKAYNAAALKYFGEFASLNSI